MLDKYLLLSLAMAVCVLSMGSAMGGDSLESIIAQAENQQKLGNYKNAASLFRQASLSPATEEKQVARNVQSALDNYQTMNMVGDMEPFLVEVRKAWPQSWIVLAATASQQIRLYPNVTPDNDGYVRSNDWDKQILDASERDRVLAIQLMVQAEALIPQDAAPEDVRAFYRNFASIIMHNRTDGREWRLSSLTPIDAPPLPDEYGSRHYYGQRGAPVDENDAPLFYTIPESWQAAANDGERWRFLLAKMADVGGRDEADFTYAIFLHSQFGVQTMGRVVPVGADAGENDTGPFAVRTLSENETIARLATGIKRFAMPDKHNFILLFRRLSGSGDFAAGANRNLAEQFENRQQYPKALSFWQRIRNDSRAAAAIEKITGKNGQLEPIGTVLAGKPTSIPYLFRNGALVQVKAERLDEKALIQDIRAHIRSYDNRPLRTNPVTTRPDQIGRIVIDRNHAKYIKETIASWNVPLQPLPDYMSSRASLDLPFTVAGCYLITATMDGGNVSRCVVWLTDTALTSKTVGDSQYWYLADAGTGQPLAGANVTFFSYANRHERGSDRPRVEVRESAQQTDANGMVSLEATPDRGYNTLTIAETGDGRFAYSGFEYFWGESDSRRPPSYPSVYVVTDRPVYRPGQTVQYKIWLGKADYSPNQAASMAGQTVTLSIQNPRGENVSETTLTLDEYGGAHGEFAVKEGGMLGMYSVNVHNVSGGVAFRVEEYKKPEYEVTVIAPDAAITLGDAATVRVKAAYYYGAPVVNATVNYTVTRTSHSSQWFPIWRWDWLYGRGAWWNTSSSGWTDAPGIWPPMPSEPPEVVAQGEGVLDADGVFRLNIDTLPAKELFGNTDHQYSIAVEVRDQSRRTITGNGTIVATRKPFSITVWADRGWYSAGDRILVHARAGLPSGTGLAAAGEAVLSKLSVSSDGSVHREEVSRHPLKTEENGEASLTLTAGQAGQYVVAVSLAGQDGNRVKQETVLTVRGLSATGDFRYAGLELVPDKREYAPGETVRLAVNSGQKDATVILFIRAEQGGKPTFIKLKNGTATVDIPIGAADQPNFYCDAVTIHSGKMHNETRQIFVPPAPKALTIDIESDKQSYLPGEKASFTLTVTDGDGKPVEGQCVVSVYDRSVEYISGGSNIPAIQEFFWSWRRYHASRIASTLQRRGYVVIKDKDVLWQPIGIFGGSEADWNDGGMVAEPLPASRIAMGEMMNAEISASADMAVASAAAPAPEAPRQQNAKKSTAMNGGMGGPAFTEPRVRSEFADTALWLVNLRTDGAGKATFSLAMPENLTAWKARAWFMASGTRVGEGERVVETKKNLIVRPQAPRFLTQTDQVVLSANLHNYLPRAKAARAEIVLEGGLLHIDPADRIREVTLDANGEARVDWLVTAKRPGEAVVIMKLMTDEESDAAEIRVPVIIHGARRVQQLGGTLRRGDAETVVTLLVPEKMLPDQSKLEFSFSGSIAVQLLDALPYVIEYPYGCTEQTLNRFLPVVMTRSHLDRLGLSLGVDRAGDKKNPVFDDAKLAAMTSQGIERLASMQVSDGGWGWFSGYGERSYPHTTAVVVHGLLAAKENNVPLPSGMLERGVDWLRGERQDKVNRLAADPEAKKIRADDIDALVHMLLMRAGYPNPDMRDFLQRDRVHLSLTGLSMYGIALHEEKAGNFLPIVLENLAQYVHQDKNGTAWLENGSGRWWYWYSDRIEMQAWYLMLLNRVEPQGEIAAGLAKYLLANRKNGTYWRSTRDTAYAIEALTQYAVASGEISADMTVALYYDGEKVLERQLTAATILADNRFVLDGIAVEPGLHEIRLARTGDGPVYFGGRLDVFSLEDPVPEAGGDLAVKRSFYKLHREDREALRAGQTGRAESVREENHRREKLDDPFTNTEAAVVQSGDLIEVELTIEAKNDYEYLVFEDMKAAGLEAVELRSGYSNDRIGAYIEYRDQKVALFVRWLPRGVHTISYRFRAETPGRFSALPAFGGGMYAPELAGNSTEMKITVQDGK